MKTIDEQIDNAKKLLAYLEEQKENECEAVTEAKPELPEMWIPKVGSDYYAIDSAGDVSSSTWYADEVDVKRYTLENIYKTREEAEFDVECLKVRHELRRYIYEHGGGSGEYVKYGDNWFLSYSPDKNEIRYSDRWIVQLPVIYSNSEQILKDAIQAIGEDRIKKYYLRVKE